MSWYFLLGFLWFHFKTILDLGFISTCGRKLSFSEIFLFVPRYFVTSIKTAFFPYTLLTSTFVNYEFHENLKT